MDLLDRFAQARALERLGGGRPRAGAGATGSESASAGDRPSFIRRDLALSLAAPRPAGPLGFGRCISGDAGEGRPAILGGCLDRLTLPSQASLAGDLACLGAARGGASPVFIDTETTGLGGASLAFIVGVAWYEAAQLRLRQWTLARLGGEAELLADLFECLGRLGPAPLVSFNGASFDLPLLRVRAQRHRLGPSLAELERGLDHVDLLHPGRRLSRGDGPDCKLATLERSLLAIRREGDIDSAEIPGVFWAWLEEPEDLRAQRRLQAVLDHNLVDLVSLPALAARLAERVREPEDLERARRVARHLQAHGAEDRARALLARFVEPGLDQTRRGDQGSRWQDSRWREAALELAILERRAGAFDRAAKLWRAAWLRDPGCPVAAEALAKHLEHRVGDFAAALEVARGSRLACARRIARLEARLARESEALASPPEAPSARAPARPIRDASPPASGLAVSALASAKRSELLHTVEDERGVRLRYRLLR